MRELLMVMVGTAILVGCSTPLPKPAEPSGGHLRPHAEAPAQAIPKPVTRTPFLPPPTPSPKQETYTVVVSNVPVKELLFALARDASLNVDIDEAVTGNVTLNAVDQTLPQILDRLGRQIDLRYEIRDNNLIISPDRPYLRTYKVDYVNMSRESTGSISVSTQVATSAAVGGGAGSGSSQSSATITNEMSNKFWETLTENITGLLGESKGRGTQSVITNPSAGLITVRATGKQHKDVQAYIDQVLASARRQVLIEATIVEVELNDQYQSGVDWSKITLGEGLTVLAGAASSGVSAGAGSSLVSAAFGAGNSVPYLVLDYQGRDNRNDGVTLTVNLLKEFGDTKVLSSPKLMSLNNQTSVLKVVDNEVYFTVDVDITEATATASSRTTFTTTVNTVPIGLIMTVTPQISEDGRVILNVRPTISRKTGAVNDPNPQLADAGVVSPIPIIQTREMESVLKVNSGQVAVLGGLMQDSDSRSDSGVPLLSDLVGIGEAFKHRDNKVKKSELVIFIRPVVIKEASLDKDLKAFAPFLRRATSAPAPVTSSQVETVQ